MSRRPAGSTASTDDGIALAREAPFTLGRVTVTPAELSLRSGDWSYHLEPRAMQVLLVLARASPAVVGRDELNARVWGGRVVGEDAINRAVQTLRRVAAEAPQPAPFRIETIPRVGYRLASDATASSERSTQRWSAGRIGRWAAWSLVVALILVGSFVLWRLLRTDRESGLPWTIVTSATLDDLPPEARDVTLSPDGRRLAYRARDTGGRDRIFVRARNGGGAGTPVSADGIDAQGPAWSPDSASLAFSSYDPARPCRLYVLRPRHPASTIATCETQRDPHLSWTSDGRSLLFTDAPGWNAVPRIVAIRLADGRRSVLTSPPGDSMGDQLPLQVGTDLIFQRQFAWADEGWISRDLASGRERLLWRRRGIAGSVAAGLPGGALAIAWTLAGASGLDIVTTDGRVAAQPLAAGLVTAISAAGPRLLVETDRSETALVRAGEDGPPMAVMRGRIAAPLLLPDRRMRFAVVSAGLARIWEVRSGALPRPWSALTAERISGLTLSPDGRFTAAMVTRADGREIVLFDVTGRPVYRWNPHARSLNPAVWSADARQLIAPVLDGAGWRLFQLDPFGGAAPRDVGIPGFAVLQRSGPALYAVRAGETTGYRELWRLDGGARRLPVDVTLFDIVNWRAVSAGIWMPDRSDRDRPRLALHDLATGRVLRSLAAPDLAGAGSGLAADAHGPVYVKLTRDAPDYSLLTLTR